MFFKKISTIISIMSLIGSLNYQQLSNSKTGGWACSIETNKDGSSEVETSSITIGKYDDSTIKVNEHNYSTNQNTLHVYYNDTSTEQKTFNGTWPRGIQNCTYRDYLEKDFRYTKDKSNVNLTTVTDGGFLSQPYTSTGLLKTNGSEFGSCFLLSNGYALTAAHCVYLNGGYHPNLTATFRFNSDSYYTKTVRITNAYLPKGWINLNPSNSNDEDAIPTEAQKNVDWAILKFDDSTLPQTFGATTIASNITITQHTHYISLGYPRVNDYKLTYSLGTDYISQTKYRYNLYTSVRGGMSGGPLIGLYDEFDERIQDFTYYNYIIGINSTQEPDTNENMYYDWSGFTRITNTMIDIIGGLSA